MLIIWTKHAEERQIEWQSKLGITRHEIEQAIRNPEQVVSGDQGAFVAQTRRANGLLRIPFTETEGNRKILTVYWTSKVDRYWRNK